jgi:uncharacterized protein YcnI
MVELRPDDRLTITCRPGESSAVEITIEHDGRQVVTYETNSRPWAEGTVQIRNVIAMNLDEHYSRDEARELIESVVDEHEVALRELFE